MASLTRHFVSAKIIFMSAAKFMLPMIVSYFALGIGLCFTGKKLLLNSKHKRKMTGHHTCLQENEDLTPWCAPAIKKKPPFFNMHAATNHSEIMHSRGAQCHTKE